MVGWAGLSGAGGGVETFGWEASFGVSIEGGDGLATVGGACGFQGTVGTAVGAGPGAGLLWSGLLPPGVITIGLLAGVARGGTHSRELSIEKELEGSETSSGGMSLRSDCNNLLNEESSSPIAAGDAAGDHLGAWYDPVMPLGGGLGGVTDGLGTVDAD